jgi:hypothetical protein
LRPSLVREGTAVHGELQLRLECPLNTLVKYIDMSSLGISSALFTHSKCLLYNRVEKIHVNQLRLCGNLHPQSQLAVTNNRNFGSPRTRRLSCSSSYSKRVDNARRRSANEGNVSVDDVAAKLKNLRVKEVCVSRMHILNPPHPHTLYLTCKTLG